MQKVNRKWNDLAAVALATSQFQQRFCNPKILVSSVIIAK